MGGAATALITHGAAGGGMVGKDLTDFEADLRALRARVEAQAAEIDELRGARPNRDEPVSRRHLLAGLAGLGAAGVASVAAAEPAAAADGDPLLLGQANTATGTTSLTSTDSGAALLVRGGGFSSLIVESRDDGYSGTQWAVIASALGTSADSNAIFSQAVGGFAVYGSNTSNGLPAVGGVNKGPGAGLGGGNPSGGAQLYLEPAEGGSSGPPSGQRPIGEIKLDSLGDIWVCVEGAGPGRPSTWTRLLREDTAAGRVVPITPLRVLDTRSPGGRVSGGPLVPGQTQGPIAHLQTLTLDLAGVTPIPPDATGVVGNATVVTPTGGGYLRVYPAGTSVLTSTVNFAKGSITANGFTCALSATGMSTRASIVGAGTYHLVLDITAYIT